MTMSTSTTETDYINGAKQAMAKAYAPYSNSLLVL